VNRDNVKIFGSQEPHHVTAHINSSIQVIMSFRLMFARITCPVLFTEAAVTRKTRLDALQLFALSQAENLHLKLVFESVGGRHVGIMLCVDP
jgi:hypothetical protein